MGWSQQEKMKVLYKKIRNSGNHFILDSRFIQCIPKSLGLFKKKKKKVIADKFLENYDQLEVMEKTWVRV